MVTTFININGSYRPEVTCSSRLEEMGTIRLHKMGGIYRATAYADQEGNIFYGYGFMADDPTQRPGHGGEWSSNPTRIRQMLGLDLKDCIVKLHPDSCSYALAMKRSDIVLPPHLIWEEVDCFGPTYNIVEVN